MKAHLMHPKEDFTGSASPPSNAESLVQDLELRTLFDAMAGDDPFLLKTVSRAVLSSLRTVEDIQYRQRVLKDCLDNPSVARRMYALAVEGVECEKKGMFSLFSRYPAAVLRSAVELMRMLVGVLRVLRAVADAYGDLFHSEGFTNLFQTLQGELRDEYFAAVEAHLKELEFSRGVLVSARLGAGNKGSEYVLRKPLQRPSSLLGRIFNRKEGYTLTIGDRDEAGARALSELRDRGINLAANALAQSAHHILSFFTMLRTELGFYVGCLNLRDRVAALGEPVAFPVPAAAAERSHSFTGLYDVCLALRMARRVVGNDVHGDRKDLVIVTGANQGGKSTFLRSIGLAQLMMQCGMFVGAESFQANVCRGVFTHYKRREDATMKSGKLDEELSRMSDLVDGVTSDALALFNESFAATNEREGSAIAGDIVSALLERRVKMFFVTHLYEFSRAFHQRGLPGVLFLRAERRNDGSRTYRVVEGEPLETSHGEDLYRAIFARPEAKAV